MLDEPNVRLAVARTHRRASLGVTAPQARRPPPPFGERARASRRGAWPRSPRRSRAPRAPAAPPRPAPQSASSARPELNSALPSPHPVADLARDRELLLVELDRPPRLAEVRPGRPDCRARCPRPAGRRSRARSRALLVELDRPPRLAEGRPGVAQIAERGALAPPVADLARDRQLPARSISIARRGSPRSAQALPRLPSAVPSPRRSPISRTIASSCS